VTVAAQGWAVAHGRAAGLGGGARLGGSAGRQCRAGWRHKGSFTPAVEHGQLQAGSG
jgi:hypothetical protein